jgi:hypothetical protein
MALIRWLLLVVLALTVLRLVRFALVPARRPVGPRPQRPPVQAGTERLVKDPVCGLLLPESRAVREGEAFYCSEDCRRASHAR